MVFFTMNLSAQTQPEFVSSHQLLTLSRLKGLDLYMFARYQKHICSAMLLK